MIEFYRYFCPPTMSIGNYFDQLKRGVSQLDYASIILSQEQIAEKFINSFGSDLTTIRNTIPLPSAWTTTTIDELTPLSRNHLSLMVSNREINKRQRKNTRLPRQPPAPTPGNPCQH